MCIKKRLGKLSLYVRTRRSGYLRIHIKVSRSCRRLYWYHVFSFSLLNVTIIWSQIRHMEYVYRRENGSVLSDTLGNIVFSFYH